MNERQRRTPRRAPTHAVIVTDAMTGQAMGRIGNLSAGGMLLIADQALPIGTLYQVQFTLPVTGHPSRTFELGMQLLWSDAGPGQRPVWGGFRFISIAPDQAQFLHAWSQSRS
ncbi:MAG: pilus assembly protein PilZ [Pseudoxanthomonas suwonensis]|nr:MAG: pilus assembly protein PilZ [Pseudoxanthomonas suwonensis]